MADWATIAAALSTGVVGLAGIAATATVATQERRHRDSERLYGSCVALLRNIDNTIVVGRQALIWDRLHPDVQEQLYGQSPELSREATAALSSLRLQLPNGSPIDKAARRLVAAGDDYAKTVNPGVNPLTLKPLEVELLERREIFIAELQRIVPPPRRWKRRSRDPQKPTA